MEFVFRKPFFFSSSSFMSVHLTVGQTNTKTITVTEENTAAVYGSGLAPVLSTPHVAAMFECACKELLDKGLDEGQSSVGASISVSHNAPTPVGMKVEFTVEVVSVEKRKVVFKGTAKDECEVVATCEHTRFAIDYEKFMKKVQAKSESVKH